MSCDACRNAPDDGKICRFCGERCRYTVAREKEKALLEIRKVEALEAISRFPGANTQRKGWAPSKIRTVSIMQVRSKFGMEFSGTLKEGSHVPSLRGVGVYQISFGTTQFDYTLTAPSSPEEVEVAILKLLEKTPPTLGNGMFWVHLVSPEYYDVQLAEFRGNKVTLAGDAFEVVWQGPNCYLQRAILYSQERYRVLYVTPLLPPPAL